MKIIKGSQYWLREDQITDVEEFKERFTFTPKFEDSAPVPTYTVADLVVGDTEVERYYGFPRNYDVELAGYEVEDTTTIGHKIEVPFLGEMWEYQEPVIMDFADRLNKGYNDLILSADTGSGKTVMLLKMWSMLKVPALVIVPKSDLMDQWVSRIQQFTGLERKDIGIARQKVCDYKDKKIVVGMIHSLCKDKYPEEFKRYFGLVIFDELHKLGAFTFSQVGGMFPAKYRLGATATLRRSDGMAKVFYAHLGDEVIKPLIGDQPVPKIIVVRYGGSSGRIPHWASGKVKRRATLFSLLMKNYERTKWITDLAAQLINSGRQTVVLGERIVQLQDIRENLTTKDYGIAPSDVGMYIGSTSEKQREQIRNNCMGIMATTSMMSLGTDIPTLRGLVFATPLADVEQAIGRVCRICADTQSPIVIDFVDNAYTEAKGWLQGRLKLYKKKDWKVDFA